jgi:NADPH:quinone reductase-like Zn-dependent oxidoreductase
MGAAVFETPSPENLKVVDNVEESKVSDHEVLIKVKVTGINPIDHFVVSDAFQKHFTMFLIISYNICRNYSSRLGNFIDAPRGLIL